MRICFTFILFVVLISCKPRLKNQEKENISETSTTSKIEFAKGFTIQNLGKNEIITIHNPWQKAEGVAYQYILSANDTFPSEIENAIRIKIPVRKIICLSTTHLGFINFIGETDAVVGISGARYVTNPKIREKIKQGFVSDIGYEESINYELIVRLQPDLVIAYGVSGNETSYLRKIEELGIRVIYIAEYLEENPLAKMEWVKVFAALFNKEKEISVKFDSVASYYHSLTIKVIQLKQKPSVLLGLPWKGTWYISGGKSYVAKLISDAGGNYLWKDLDFRDSRPMSLESIYSQALNADFWLNTGTANSIKDILEVDKRFENINAVGKGNIYNYNNLTVKSGGNAYFESGVVEPEIILEDLITILHPDVLPSHQLKYYKKLN